MPAYSPSSSSSAPQAVEFRQQEITLASPHGESIVIDAEIAETGDQHQRGLMFRDHLDPRAGMLFVFNRQQPVTFWMKNTLIPLDILFFDAAGNLVSSTTMEPCRVDGDACPLYPSAAPARYALEVHAGFVSQYQIERGWTLLH